ncbi:nucleoside-diphosphate sugar epimerase/dehydratase [uncultured Amphritea sp.]|uniref:polysaccharide biosynthesis protein n=1 Tax=uncultured Amphritea sp. TaxID=981605 RepID=UPI00262E874E|nr:nucleoside-diphosphate sugar epimerase/dehydratase [uncultured Amphritea sp.]
MYDFLSLMIAIWGSFVLRVADFWPESYLRESAWMFLIIPVFGVLLFDFFGLYRVVVRYAGSYAIWIIIKSILILSLGILFVDAVLDFPFLPRTVAIGFSIIAFVLIGGGRFAFRNYYYWLQKHYVDKQSVLIYGAGAAGVRLASGMTGDCQFFPCGYLDDDVALRGKMIKGLKVYSPDCISTLIENYKVDRVFIALPSVDISRKAEIIKSLEGHPVHVQTLPTIDEIANGSVSLDLLREIELEELLGRDPVPARMDLVTESLFEKNVLITGAGGSIGSELCRQVIKSAPRSVILYELSEYSLYQVDQSLRCIMESEGINLPIYPLLGSVCDEQRVAEVIRRFNVHTIYHAAAYKHVPIVEHNVLQGIVNNAFGTKVVAEQAARLNVERFVLISTDKAVRPTNVMGATKRLAEAILQNLALVDGCDTKFSMVRFGNVLGSSGSVVPLFREQIKSGGPVTVTHPEITRYFMTIPEAASLVIQAGSMGQDGDVFVLDMGDSVKILDLAKRMIKLTGFSVSSSGSDADSIEIVFTGLRPGEKLYEELLIGDDVTRTAHPKIMRAREEIIASEKLELLLVELQNAVSEGDSAKARILLQNNISGFIPSSELVDLLYTQIVRH